jgi:hypothetical protein
MLLVWHANLMAYMLLLGSFDSLFFWRALVDEPNGDELDGRGQEYYYK